MDDMNRDTLSHIHRRFNQIENSSRHKKTVVNHQSRIRDK